MGPSFALLPLPHRVLGAVNSALQQGQVGLAIEHIIRKMQTMTNEDTMQCMFPYLEFKNLVFSRMFVFVLCHI